MDNFVTLFNDIYNKFIDDFVKNNNLVKENKISSSEQNYLGIIYNLKKITLTKFAELAKVITPAATQIVCR